MAAPACLRAVGPDAARFLHSQLTNEVEAVEPGAGNHQARVARTGHLQHLLTLHRASPEAFVLLTEADAVDALAADLDAFLFADQVTLTVDRSLVWIAVQGPLAAELMDRTFGPLGFEPWSSLPDCAVRAVTRARAGVPVPAGLLALRRSLTGDVGYLLAAPAGGPELAPLAEALAAHAEALSAVVLDAGPFSDALEILRVEAGVPRLGPDTIGRRRLLPETGLEQLAVSYSKGCYLGQEVIARVRTYGSVPFLLRGLLVEGDAALPEPGADLVTADGATIGQIASHAWSPVRERTVALAWLDRAHRTPGLHLSFAGGWTATVALLPLYAAPDTASRARQLYDLAVRSYADGDTDLALSRMEAALRVDPSLADAYEAIGVILGKAGRFHDAIDFFRRLEEVVPDEPMVNTNLSLYYMKIGDKETAEDEGGKATLKGMARLRGRTSTDVDQELEQSKLKDAQRKAGMFRRVLTIDEADSIALFGLGTALLTLGQHEEAAGHLRRAVEVDPKNSPVWLALGKALERCDQVDAAVETYRKGVEVAARKGDLMPLKEMEHRLLLLGRR